VPIRVFIVAVSLFVSLMCFERIYSRCRNERWADAFPDGRKCGS
jgi:hypothetical protein